VPAFRRAISPLGTSASAGVCHRAGKNKLDLKGDGRVVVSRLGAQVVNAAPVPETKSEPAESKSPDGKKDGNYVIRVVRPENQNFASAKHGGLLKPGDTVRLDKDGKLFVNGQERSLTMDYTAPEKPAPAASRHYTLEIENADGTIDRRQITPPGTPEIRGNNIRVTTGLTIAVGDSKHPRLLSFQAGRVGLDGKDGGQLQPGDTVRLDKDWRLFVDGQERTLK
jgi:hypothetical protein